MFAPARTILSSDPLATLAAAARRRAVTCTMPTVAELVARAVGDTDFLGDLTPTTDTLAHAADYADQAAEQWEDALGEVPGTVAPELVLAAASMLRKLADMLLDFAAIEAADARADAIEAGDVDPAGDVIPYATRRAA
jgi:hypothetical protein